MNLSFLFPEEDQAICRLWSQEGARIVQAKGNSGSIIYSHSKAVISHCQNISFQELLLLCVKKTLGWENHDDSVLSC